MSQQSIRQQCGNQRGAMAVTIAITSSLILMFSALALDVGHALLTKNELQNAADAAALAATRQLGLTFNDWAVAKQLDTSASLSGTEIAAVTGSAVTASQANSAADLASVDLMATDIQLGFWDFWNPSPTFIPVATFVPTATLWQPNAVQVTTRRDSTSGAPNGPISTFFAGVLGVSQMDVSATAVAALGTGGGVSPPGVADAPFGLDIKTFQSKSCNDEIAFSPTTTSCSGWHAFDATPANKTTIEGQINGLVPDPPTFTTPGVVPGTTAFTFSGGEITNLYGNLKALMTAKQEWDPADSRMEWNIKIPVYDDGSAIGDPCGNPSGAITIVGYATASVYYVGTGIAADKDIKAQILCNVTVDTTPNPNPGPGAPAPWATKTPYPRLVS